MTKLLQHFLLSLCSYTLSLVIERCQEHNQFVCNWAKGIFTPLITMFNPLLNVGVITFLCFLSPSWHDDVCSLCEWLFSKVSLTRNMLSVSSLAEEDAALQTENDWEDVEQMVVTLENLPAVYQFGEPHLSCPKRHHNHTLCLTWFQRLQHPWYQAERRKTKSSKIGPIQSEDINIHSIWIWSPRNIRF